jgi:ferredoxin-NADP reductase
MEFVLERPAGFEFKAGQNADWKLISPPETDSEGDKRTFSIVAPPSARELAFTTRMRDTAFKRVLKTLPEGSALEIDGPYGDLTLHNRAERPAVFLAGGIGITPFHSMILDAAEKHLPHKIFLFYSNRRPEDAAFLQELIDLQSKNVNYKLIATMTDMDKSSQKWNGETGRIDAELIKKYVGDLNGPVYYIAGPPGLVAAMKKMLNDAGVNDDDIKIEDFPGY